MPEPESSHLLNLAQFFDAVQLVTVATDAEGRITYCNDRLLEITDWSRERVLGGDFLALFFPQSAGMVRPCLDSGIKSVAPPWHGGHAVIHRGNESVVLHWNTSEVCDERGHFIGFLNIGEDKTERLRLRGELLCGNQQERQHLAAELHDGLGQTLFAASIMAKGLEANLQKQSLPAVSAAAELTRALDQCRDECWRIAEGLSPLSRLRGGLPQALYELRRSGIDSGVAVTVAVNECAPICASAPVLDHLYRIAQEALVNALKHANATTVAILLEITPTEILLRVCDDGIGMSTGARGDRLGLSLMRYRSELLDAQLSIGLNQPTGTQISIRCPQGR